LTNLFRQRPRTAATRIGFLVTGSFVGSINEQCRSYRPENGILTLH
jgi:hypothetical protein